MEEKKISINNLELNYKIAGEDQRILNSKGIKVLPSETRQVLILHGWGGSSDSWAKVTDILANNGFKVVCPDFPGFGKSKTPFSPWDLNDYTAWVDEFIKFLNLEKFILIGHSFGGRVAIKFSVKYPEKISKLILVAAGGAESIETSNELEKKVLKNFSSFMKKFSFLPGYDFLRKIFYRFIIKKTDYLKVEGILKEIFKKVIKENLIPYLTEIKPKTLIVWGKKDDIFPLREGILMKEMIPDSKIEILENIKHNPHAEAPEKLTEILIDFLRS